MYITVKEFVENASGVGEYEIWGKTKQDGSRDYDFFFKEDLIKNPPAYEKFKERKIESFKFKSERAKWVECVIYLQD